MTHYEVEGMEQSEQIATEEMNNSLNEQSSIGGSLLNGLAANTAQEGSLCENSAASDSDKNGPISEADTLRYFIGGLSPQTTQAHLLDYLSKFACVCNVDIKIDPVTGRNRGYGFFSVRKSPGFDPSILLEMKHSIDDKRVDIREFRKDASDKPYLKRKIFVGGVNPALAEEVLWTHFGQFGTVETVSIIKDPYTGKNRGFAFVEFENEEGASRALATSSHQLDEENRCDVRAAEQRPAGSQAGRGRGTAFAHRPPAAVYDYSAARYYGAHVYAAPGAVATAAAPVAPVATAAGYYAASPQYYAQQGYTQPQQVAGQQSPYGYSQYGAASQYGHAAAGTESYSAIRRSAGGYSSRPY